MIMMKMRIICILLSMLLLVLFAIGCTDQAASKTNGLEADSGDSTTIAADDPNADGSFSGVTVEPPSVTGRESPATKEPVDVDLTLLGATMLSAEISNMIMNSQNYLGKTVRVSGLYSSFFYAQAERYIHYVITKDGDECCQEGIEIILTGGRTSASDYPAQRIPIEIVGVFCSYEELGMVYFRLEVDDIDVL